MPVLFYLSVLRGMFKYDTTNSQKAKDTVSQSLLEKLWDAVQIFVLQLELHRRVFPQPRGRSSLVLTLNEEKSREVAGRNQQKEMCQMKQ